MMASQATPLETFISSKKKSDLLILINCYMPVDKARLKVVVVTHAGDWLNAPPITAVGLRLSDEAVHVAVDTD